MELDDRKVMILNAVIKNYMETGEPVGSRTISKLPGCALSSATIRNEMYDLEEMGYLLQPHTSAGRIPSDQGYRFYVNEILREIENEVEALKRQFVARVDRLELVLRRMARIAADHTNYAAVISGPDTSRARIKLLQLSKMDESRLLVVLVLEGNLISNRILTLRQPIGDAELLQLNILLNTRLNGVSIQEAEAGVMQKLLAEAGDNKEFVAYLLDELRHMLSEEEELQIYTSGATNVFRYPELTDGGGAKRIIRTFEEKNRLKRIVADAAAQTGEEKENIQVFIGEESPVPEMNDCSIVTARYDLGGGLRGTIGIVGPKRMDYEKVLKTLHSLMREMDENFGGDDG